MTAHAAAISVAATIPGTNIAELLLPYAMKDASATAVPDAARRNRPSGEALKKSTPEAAGRRNAPPREERPGAARARI
jgi:hypothetical protein